MGISKRQQMLIRIGEAFVNGDNPNPADVEYCRLTTAGRPQGMSYKQFLKMLNHAFAYLYNMAQGMNSEEAREEANKGMGVAVPEKSLESYCKYLKSGPLPDDQRARWHLEYTRAALEQVERIAGKNPKTRQKVSKDYDFPMEAPRTTPDRIKFPSKNPR